MGRIIFLQVAERINRVLHFSASQSEHFFLFDELVPQKLLLLTDPRRFNTTDVLEDDLLMLKLPFDGDVLTAGAGS